MTHFKKNTILKALCICILSQILGTFCLSYYYLNGSTGVYVDGQQPTIIQCSVSMEIMLVDGSGYFIQTHGYIENLLNRLEKQDINYLNYFELKRLVDSALINIINAKMAFAELIKIAEATPYDMEVIGELNRFDYETFLEEYKLNPFIFAVVRDFLVKGDITGTYRHSYENFKEIEQLLLNVQSSIYDKRIPELKICWRLNELCAEGSLFGSYIARIFMALR